MILSRWSNPPLQSDGPRGLEAGGKHLAYATASCLGCHAGGSCCAAGGIDKGDKLKGPRNWLCSSRQLLRGSAGSLAITIGPDRCIFRFFLRHAASVPPPCSPATPIIL